MTTATAQVIPLQEFVRASAGRVDRESKVIRNVKVLGLESNNSARVLGVDSDENYGYSLKALREAAPLYEGVPVNIDHPEFAFDPSGERHVTGSQRKTQDRFGRLTNVRVVETGPSPGLYADLEYLSTHPLAEMVLEVAERMPDTLALSHNAMGKHERINGRIMIDEIVEVTSVDLVGEKPGTTKGLFEGVSGMAHKLAEQDQTHTAPPDPSQKIVDQDSAADTVMEQDEVGAAPSPSDAVSGGFKQAVVELLDDSSLDESGLMQKLSALIKSMMQAREALGGGDTVAEQEDEEEAPPEKENGMAAESLARRVAKLERENRAIKMLAEHGVSATEERVLAVSALQNKPRHQQALIESWSRQPEPPSFWPGRAVTEDPEIKEFPKDSKEFAAALRV